MVRKQRLDSDGGFAQDVFGVKSSGDNLTNMDQN